MSDRRTYQDAQGGWVVWDGAEKVRGFEDEQAATKYLKEKERMSAIQEWADSVRQLTKKAEDLIDGTAPGKRLRVANDLEALINAAAPGQWVEGSDMTKERAAELLEMYDALEAWLMTPLWESGPAPIQIISRRE